MPEEKTEKPTPRRREKARSEGNVAKSAEINSAAILLTGTIVLCLMGKVLFRDMTALMKHVFANAGAFSITQSSLQWMAAQGFAYLGQMLLPFFLAVVIIGLTANILQVGFMFTMKPLQPKLSKINPLSGVKKFFSLRSVVDLAKNILKVTVVGLIAYLIISRECTNYIPLMQQNELQLMAMIGTIGFKVAIWTSLAIFVIAMFDYIYQKFEFEKGLKMTKEEIKDEMKSSEGDPKVKGKIKGLQFQAVLNRMMQRVPEADVVITNPVHYAVALKYEEESMSAPTVVAKGARKLAKKIRDIAEENGVPIVENPPLAKALYQAVEVGQMIPEMFFQAVAEVLAYVYRLKHKIPFEAA
jgi:flagellar biosynthetic protein FlhB